MINTKDIVKGVNALLNSKYKGKVYSTDDKKKITKGSFRVETPFPIISMTPSFQVEEGTIRVYYFPNDKDQIRIEILNKMEELRDLFRNGIDIGGVFTLAVPEIEFEADDECLLMSFDYMVTQEVEEDDGVSELMENLEIKED